MVTLFVISGFRGEKIGSDTKVYSDLNYLTIRAYNYTSLETIKDLSLSDFGGSSEIISNTVYRTIIENNLNVRWVLLFFSFVTFLFLYYSSIRYKVPLSYILAFFCILSFFPYSCNIARQLSSASILLVAYSFLKEKGIKQLLFFFYVFFAAAIHSFSIIFILVYFVKYIKNIKTSISMTIVIILSIVAFVGVNIISLIPGINEINHIAGYLSSYEGDEVNIKSLLSSILSVSFLYYFYYQSLNKKLTNHILMNIVLISIFLMLALSSLGGPIRRFALDVSIINCVFLAHFFSSKSIKITKKTQLIFFLMCVFYTYTNYRIIEPDAPQYYLSF